MTFGAGATQREENLPECADSYTAGKLIPVILR